MEGSILAFDYCAVIILFLVIQWYFHGKRIPLASHRIFLSMLATLFVANGMEILGFHAITLFDSKNVTLFWVCSTVEHFALAALPLLLSRYILMISHIELSFDWRLKMGLTIIGGVDLVLIGTNPFLHLVYNQGDTGFEYTYVGLGMLVLAMGGIIACTIRGLVNVNREALSKNMVIIINVVFVLFAIFVQITFNKLVVNFAMAIAILSIYFSLQNPKMTMDAVTGQFNRKFMGEFMQFYYATQKAFAVIVVAMDDFKFINKTYGVDNGDNLLKQVGMFLEQMKAQKTVFRLGADQFCVVVWMEKEDYKDIAERIHERFRHPWYSGDSQANIMMSASICCLECPRDAANYGRLVEVMDYAMSMTKKLHKGTIMHANDLELNKIMEDKAVEKAVKQALDRDEIMVYYQPIFSVSKQAYNSAEALVRLHDEELGWISPEVFIPIAERNGMILEMGDIIIEKVCRFIRDFRMSETGVEYIEVNISPVQLMQPDFADHILGIMEKYEVSSKQLNLEITETATMTSADVVNENISKLVEKGIRFSLDDYGSGYANIDYINHMPFSIIKLDKSIIWDSFKNHKAGITLEHTIAMLNALKLHIVAEGVETEEMRDCLISFGCHFMQGWYYSKAVCEEDFIKLIEAQA